MRASRMSQLILLSMALLSVGVGRAQDAQTAPGGKYSVTVIEDPNPPKDMKDGRFSSETLVRVTDANQMPVSGIAVTFTIPQLKGTAFANGRLTSIVMTNDKGEASSGAFFTRAGSSFTMSVSAATPGALSTTTAMVVMPAAVPAALAKSRGISKRVLIGLVAGAGAAVAVGVIVGTRGGSNSSAGAQGTVGPAGTSTFGAP
jgi:hypothetical protein